MKPKKSIQLCAGCYNNFYNGNNPYGVAQCWSFPKAQVAKRLKIPVDMRPPYKFPPQWTLSCHQPKGYVQVKPEAITKEGYWA